MTFYHVASAVLFLLLGMIELAVLYRTLYPQLRWRYEKAKTTQSHGMDPNRVMMLFKVQSLIALPVIGLFFGGTLQEIFE